MCYRESVEGLLSFGISDITRGLRRQRKTLNKVDGILSPGSGFVEYSPEWKISSGGYLNRIERKYSCKVYIRKDTSGLFLEIVYSTQREGDTETEMKHSLRYDLTRKESNLKPGTFRYFIKDPYTPGEAGGICTRLYFLPELGEFVPRSILNSWGVRYSNQRRGHKDRYLHPKKVPSTRYRKSHYRGEETPFWRSYTERVEVEEYRTMQNLLSMGIGSGLIDQGGEILEDFYRKTGRKTSPPPLAV